MQLDSNGGVVVAPESNVWWNAHKSMMGETTTLREKVRAFRHWVYLIRRANEGQAVHLNLFYTNTTTPYNPTMPPCELVSQDIGVDPRVRCCTPKQYCDATTDRRNTGVHGNVFQQWSKLQVFVDAANRDSILRIRGKVRSDDADEANVVENVSKDDVWMAFSIGDGGCFVKLLIGLRCNGAAGLLVYCPTTIHAAILYNICIAFARRWRWPLVNVSRMLH